MKIFVITLLFLATQPAAAQTASPGRAGQWRPTLDFAALAPLENLQPAERQILDEALQLIQNGEHTLALASLTRLTESNPKNSPFRVIKAYALLQLGNRSGALKESRTAERTQPPSPYRCWFLAQIAYLSGNQRLCEREIGHVSAHPTIGPEAAKLRQELAARSGKTGS